MYSPKTCAQAWPGKTKQTLREIDTAVVSRMRKAKKKKKGSITVSDTVLVLTRKTIDVKSSSGRWPICIGCLSFSFSSHSMQQFAFIVMRQLISIKSFIVQCALTQTAQTWSLSSTTGDSPLGQRGYHHPLEQHQRGINAAPKQA